MTRADVTGDTALAIAIGVCIRLTETVIAITGGIQNTTDGRKKMNAQDQVQIWTDILHTQGNNVHEAWKMAKKYKAVAHDSPDDLKELMLTVEMASRFLGRLALEMQYVLDKTTGKNW